MKLRGLAITGIVAVAVLAVAGTLAAAPPDSAVPSQLRAAADEFEALEDERNALLEQVASLDETVDAQAAEIAALLERIEELEAQIPPSPTPSPSPTVEPCVGTPVSTAAEIAAAPAGASMCLTTELRITAPLALKAGQTLAGTGILNGSVPVTNWTTDGNLWVSTGRTEGPTVVCMAGLSPCDGNAMAVPQARFGDDIFYDSTVLTRTGDLLGLRSAVAPSFYFDYAADRVYINRDPTGRDVELAVARSLIRSSADDVTLRGITLEKAIGGDPSTPTSALYFLGTDGWVVEDVTVQLIHASGVRMGGNSVLRDSRILWTGMIGLGGSGSNIQVEDTEVGFANYARYSKTSSQLACWSAGAMKFTHATVAFDGLWSHNNWCDGWWADNDVTATVVNSVIEDNLRIGMFWELQNSGGTLVVRDTIVRNNGHNGIHMSDAGNALVERVTFGGNADAVGIQDGSRAGSPTNITIRNVVLNGDRLAICGGTITCEGIA